MKQAENDMLAKFVQKAKKKLNKPTKEVVVKKEIEKPKFEYNFIPSNRKNEEKELEEKIKNIIFKNPDVTNPLGLLIDKNLFETLSSSAKQNYIIKLSKSYTKICNTLDGR